MSPDETMLRITVPRKNMMPEEMGWASQIFFSQMIVAFMISKKTLCIL
jgi:hypothetical protein